MGSPNEDGRIMFMLFIERFIPIECLVHLSCVRIERILEMLSPITWAPITARVNWHLIGESHHTCVSLGNRSPSVSTSMDRWYHHHLWLSKREQIRILLFNEDCFLPLYYCRRWSRWPCLWCPSLGSRRWSWRCVSFRCKFTCAANRLQPIKFWKKCRARFVSAPDRVIRMKFPCLVRWEQFRPSV